MNMMVIIIEMVVFAGIFTAIVFSAYASGKQQTAAGIHNYPPDIQEEYFKTHERIEVGYKSKVVSSQGNAFSRHCICTDSCVFCWTYSNDVW